MDEPVRASSVDGPERAADRHAVRERVEGARAREAVLARVRSRRELHERAGRRRGNTRSAYARDLRSGQTLVGSKLGGVIPAGEVRITSLALTSGFVKVVGEASGGPWEGVLPDRAVVQIKEVHDAG